MTSALRRRERVGQNVTIVLIGCVKWDSDKVGEGVLEPHNFRTSSIDGAYYRRAAVTVVVKLARRKKSNFTQSGMMMVQFREVHNGRPSWIL